ncbi:MAG: glycosyltransferase [Acidimicrobiia bacterium]|nr:glycosyltransferase [Acidimicrobiia bacterium]
MVACEQKPRDHADLDVRHLHRPTTLREKAAFILWMLALEPGLLMGLLRDPQANYPVAWRLWGVSRLVKDVQPDVVHSHFAYPMGTAGCRPAHAAGALVAVTVHGVDILIDADLNYGYRLDPQYDRRIRSALSCVDLCFAATEDMRELAVELGADYASSVVVPNAVELDTFRTQEAGASQKFRLSLGIGDDDLLALSVGHLVDRKGFELGIRALEQLSDAHYVIVGDGPQRDSLEKLARRLGVDSRLHLLGSISNTDLAELFDASDVYWFLSKREAFGNVVIEAAASGIPIVGTQEGIARDLLPLLGAAHLLPQRSPDRLAALTRDLILNVDCRPDRSEDLQDFEIANRADRIVEHYQSCLSDARANRLK